MEEGVWHICGKPLGCRSYPVKERAEHVTRFE